jgi:hypothetical protein
MVKKSTIKGGHLLDDEILKHMENNDDNLNINDNRSKRELYINFYECILNCIARKNFMHKSKNVFKDKLKLGSQDENTKFLEPNDRKDIYKRVFEDIIKNQELELGQLNMEQLGRTLNFKAKRINREIKEYEGKTQQEIDKIKEQNANKSWFPFMGGRKRKQTKRKMNSKKRSTRKR